MGTHGVRSEPTNPGPRVAHIPTFPTPAAVLAGNSGNAQVTRTFLRALQASAGNQAAVAAVQRAPQKSVLDKHQCGPDDPPATLEEAKYRRGLDPRAYRSAISHEIFEQFVRGNVTDPARARELIGWSLDMKWGRMDREREANDRQTAYERGPYGRAIERRRGDKPAPRPKPGAWTADLVGGVVGFGVGIGKGVYHGGKYLGLGLAALFGSDAAAKALSNLAADDAAFVRVIMRALFHPVETFENVAAGLTALYVGDKYLTRKQQDEVKKSTGKALHDQVEKMVGKAIGKKIVLTVLAQPLLNKLSEKITKEWVQKLVKKGGGPALLVFSILGMMEDAHKASRRLKDKYPTLYADLEPDDLHMLWFMIEPHEKELRKIALQQISK